MDQFSSMGVKSHGDISANVTDDNNNNDKNNNNKNNNNNTEEGESAEEELDRMIRTLIEHVGVNGVELLISGLTTLMVSVILIVGLRQRKPSLIIPWIVVFMIQTIGTFIVFISHVASPKSLSVIKCIAISGYFLLAVYFIVCVYSYHQILKIQKRNARHFLDNDFLGEGYHTLEETSERIPPFREKTVPMNDSEDIDKENVLYAKL